MSSTPTTPDPASVEATQEFAHHVIGLFTGHAVTMMVHMGDRLGLYAALREQGALSAAELAGRTGLQERWLLEWLRDQAAAGLVAHHGDERFALSPAGAAVLADPSSPFYLAGFFNSLVPPSTLDRIAEAFSTGIGMSYEEHGKNCACTMKRMFAPSHALLPMFLGRVDGLAERLQAGIQVLDVGCGVGGALCELAQAFPNSTFTGYDASPTAIEIARSDTAQLGLTNVTYQVRRGEGLPAESKYDLVLTLDCLHDMTYPQRTLQAIRGCIRPDGVLVIKDIRCSDSVEENLGNPLSPLLYGLSVIYCMSSALSEPDGAGLGTMGFNPVVAKMMTATAGFTQFQQLEIEEDPFNFFYAVRP
ncbi:MAG: class I SAM-dependent methyltransferase [Caldilineaceae bacterium]